jgi:hypothetical protein
LDVLFGVDFAQSVLYNERGCAMPVHENNTETDFQAEVIVEIVNTALSSMQKLGLSYDDALNGILSQVAVQVDAKAMAHASQLNAQLHEIYRKLEV